MRARPGRARCAVAVAVFASGVTGAVPARAADSAPPAGSAAPDGPAVAIAVATPQAEPVTTTPSDVATSPTSHPHATLALSLGIGGLVGIGVGSVFGALAIASWSNVPSDCGPPKGNVGHCLTQNPAQATSDHDAAERNGGVSTAFFIVGGVALVAGAAIWLGDLHHGAGTSVSFAPAVGPGQAGFAMRGSF